MTCGYENSERKLQRLRNRLGAQPAKVGSNIYPESKQVPPLSADLPPIHCKTKEEAFAAACKRIDKSA